MPCSSTDTLSAAARVATIGDIDANVAKYNDGPQRVPIRVRLPEYAFHPPRINT